MTPTSKNAFISRSPILRQPPLTLSVAARLPFERANP
ncbi:MAG: hypothetical protein JWN47_2327 [Frankiales bacterium]|nr:hypothetical protein [Frankiales bacterium]